MWLCPSLRESRRLWFLRPKILCFQSRASPSASPSSKQNYIYYFPASSVTLLTITVRLSSFSTARNIVFVLVAKVCFVGYSARLRLRSGNCPSLGPGRLTEHETRLKTNVMFVKRYYRFLKSRRRMDYVKTILKLLNR